jgi:hypothetical protein
MRSLGRYRAYPQRVCHHQCSGLSSAEELGFTQDIDILVSTENSDWDDPEDIKETIVREDDRYFLVPSSKPGATYNKLYCRLPGWTIEDRCVKVDILVAPTGKLKLPDILSSDVEIINNIPVMPIFVLLVLKTQGWRDHRKSPRADLRAKEDDDVFDICALLERAEEENISYDEEAYNYSQQFMDRALSLAKKFISFHGTRHQWRALDFPV